MEGLIMRRKVILCFMVFALLCSHVLVIAGENSVEKGRDAKLLEAELLLQQLVKIRTKESIDDLSIQRHNRIYNTMKEVAVINQLEKVGLRLATQKDLEFINTMNQSDINSPPNFDLLQSNPPQWGPYANVDIFVWGQDNINGHTMYTFFAVPKSGGGAPLLRHHPSIELTNQPTPTHVFVQSLFSIYVQKLIGQVKVVEWFPYELLFPSPPTYDYYDKYSLEISESSTMKYVFKYFPNSDVWNLVASANYVEVQVRHTAVAYVQGSGFLPHFAYTNHVVVSDQYHDLLTLGSQSLGSYNSYPVGRQYVYDNDNNEVYDYLPPFATYAHDLY